MDIRLTIYKAGTASDVRCEVEKWTFSDTFMGEQYLSFDVKSPEVIDWQIGDWCTFRGQEFTLNYIPSCRQKARRYESGDAFVYENVKMNPYADELTRCIMLDVVPTTGSYSQYSGTNYTGSANFALYCGQTTWNGNVYAPVHTLTDRIKANLDRLYPDAGWQILVNDAACESEDAILTFNNWTATQALAEIHNTFKCDYAVIGRTIYVGYTLPELTSTQALPTDPSAPGSVYYFGYGKGYPTAANGGGTALFEINRTADSNQNIITRLRAYGSTKNMPYRYYMEHYNLPQTMFVHNLQLPDTFLPYSADSDPDHEYDRYKTTGNDERDQDYGEGVFNHVLGETNDAYIDKGNDAASCGEGIREGVGAWDGSQSDLEEIYPTIVGMTYGQLRAGGVPDINGTTGGTAYPNYGDDEPINALLGVDTDVNVGDGIVPLAGLANRTYAFNVGFESVPVLLTTSDAGHIDSNYYSIPELQYAGNYSLSPTTDNVKITGTFTCSAFSGNVSTSFRYYVKVYLNSSTTPLVTYNSVVRINSLGGEKTTATSTIDFVAIPDTLSVAEGETPKVERIHFDDSSNVRVELGIVAGAVNIPSGVSISFKWQVTPTSGDLQAHLVWGPVEGESMADEPFHVFLKELGFDLSQYVALNDETPQISMKTGNCVGRTFDISGVESYRDSSTGKYGWRVELERAVDDNIHVYYPNEQNTLAAEDEYVLLNIELPDAYIKAAEVRLLRAATDYLADNSTTKYTYEPSLNDIYLQQNLDKCEVAGHIEQSIWWKLYAGLKFPFRGIPEDNDEQSTLPLMDITISKVEIRMGEKATPQVSIQLNDDVEQSTLQKITVAVDRMYNAVGYASYGGASVSIASMMELLKTEGEKRFLSRLNPDAAAGRISFMDGLEVGSNTGVIDKNGDASLRNMKLAGTQTVAPENTSDSAVAEFGDTMDSMLDGRGTLITGDGRLQTGRMEVRDRLTVLDLVATQIHSLDGYYYFTDTMKIKEVTWLVYINGAYHVYGEDADDESYVEHYPSSLRFKLTLDKEFDNDRLKFYKNDILLTISTNVDAMGTATRTLTSGGNAGFDVSMSCWLYVLLTSEEDTSSVFEDGEMAVVCSRYATSVYPVAGAYIARRGNDRAVSASDSSMLSRRTSWCISVEEGRLTYYINQVSNTVGDENYGVAIGKLPDIGPVSGVGLVGEVGIYTRYLLYEQATQVRWAGNAQYITLDMGEWDSATASDNQYVSSKTTRSDGVVVYRRSLVTHNHCQWVSPWPTSAGTFPVTGEPGEVADWHLYAGGNSEYLHLAWCQALYYDQQGNIPTSWEGHQSETGFVTEEDKDDSVQYKYMGTLVNTESGTQGITVAGNYTWNEIKGEDAISYSIALSASTVTLHSSTSRTPTSINITAMKAVGTDVPVTYSGTLVAYDVNGNILGSAESHYALTITTPSSASAYPLTISLKDSNSYELTSVTVGAVSDGSQGYPGCVVRLFENQLVQGQKYRNDTNASSGLENNARYLDYVAVKNDTASSGYIVYVCGTTFTFTDATVDLTAKTAAQLNTYMTGLGFTLVSINSSSAFFTNLIAKDARIEMLSGSMFVITDSSGNVLAGMGKQTDEDGNTYYMWSGGATPEDATFNVLADGTINALKGSFSGFLTSKETMVTYLNVFDYVDATIDPYESAPAFVFDISKIGSALSFYQSYSGEVDFEGTSVPMYPLGYTDILANGDQDTYGDSIHLNLPYDIGGVTQRYRDTFLSYFGSSGLGLYKLYNVLNGMSVADADHLSSTDMTADTSEEWMLFPFQYVSDISRRARELVGNRMTIRSYGDPFKIMNFTGIIFDGTTDGPTAISGLHTVRSWDEIIAGSGGTSDCNSVTLECRQFEFRNGSIPYQVIGWVPTPVYLGYYDRYTIGLPDISNS